MAETVKQDNPPIILTTGMKISIQAEDGTTASVTVGEFIEWTMDRFGEERSARMFESVACVASMNGMRLVDPDE